MSWSFGALQKDPQIDRTVLVPVRACECGEDECPRWCPAHKEDHDAVRDELERIYDPLSFAWAVPAPEPFTPAFLLSLMTRAPKATWRWDVDFSLDAAVRMAEFAQTAGISGTFYVMATSSEYNPFSLPGRRAVEEIRAHGQRVGMHVDERCSTAPGEPRAAVAHAGHLFYASGLPVDVTTASFHMPTDAVLWRDSAEFESAYASQWKGRYVSDSRREWDDEKTARLVAGAGEGMQVCLHPEHWF